MSYMHSIAWVEKLTLFTENIIQLVHWDGSGKIIILIPTY